MGKIILKTAKRETSVTRRSVREAVSEVYRKPSSGTKSSKNNGSSQGKKAK